jgi:hypothetical protein
MQVNAQLMQQMRDLSSSYQKSLDTIIVELAKCHQEFDNARRDAIEARKETMLALKEAAEGRQMVQELQKEVTTLTELVKTLTLNVSTTTPSVPVSSLGRSWASIVSQSSLASSNTRAARAGLGLPAVVLDLRSATEETRVLMGDPTQTREKILTAFKEDAVTESVGIEGVQWNTVKVFVDSEDSAANLRQQTR